MDDEPRAFLNERLNGDDRRAGGVDQLADQLAALRRDLQVVAEGQRRQMRFIVAGQRVLMSRLECLEGAVEAWKRKILTALLFPSAESARGHTEVRVPESDLKTCMSRREHRR